jgi:hypothetical protein
MDDLHHDDDHEDDESYTGSDSSLDPTQKGEASSNTDGKNDIATKETREVRQVKCVILLVVFMSVLGAFMVFFYSKQSEQTKCETTFYSDGENVLQFLERLMERSSVALDNLAAMIVTVARVTNTSFPFVSVPGFGAHVAKIAPLVGAMCTYYCPLVTFDQRKQYEQFTSGNNKILQAYVNETIKFQSENPFYYGPKIQNDWKYRNSIHMDDYENPPFSDTVSL